MKWLTVCLAAALFLVAVANLVIQRQSVDATGKLPPTPAPTATPGPYTNSFNSAYTELTQPLQSETQALDAASAFDAQIAKWDMPWSSKTLQTDPGRITIQSFADRSYDGSAYGPGVETGPVWVVSIRGKVRLNLEDSSVVYDGVTYTIGQRTGHLLQTASGTPVQ